MPASLAVCHRASGAPEDAPDDEVVVLAQGLAVGGGSRIRRLAPLDNLAQENANEGQRPVRQREG